MEEQLEEDKRAKGLIKDTDRHENDRWYYRRKGMPKVRLREPYGSDSFWEEYAAAVLGVPYVKGGEKPKPVQIGGKAAPGSFRYLVEQYMARAVANQATHTRSRKRLVLDEICQETCLSKSGETTTGKFAYRKMEPRHIAIIRDQKPGRPSAANNRIKIVSAMFEWALQPEVGLAIVNPARGVKKLQESVDGHHTITDDEMMRYEATHAVGTKARLAYEIFRCTGLRICDASVFGRQHLYKAAVTLLNGEQIEQVRFRITPKKTSTKTAVVVDMPVLEPLALAIAALPLTDMTFLVTEFGKPFSEKGLGNKMRDWFDEAQLFHCSSHGIRKADATIAAENGATGHELMGMMGWTTLKQAEIYTRKADRKKLADSGSTHLLSRR
ncbi:MAG: tyrosine-type recombinase/integrase [Alphaproteobacteria bacterium]|nr:tyrosine-type recombinase/integrase [Alphaproteobacteria bacterium]